MTTEVGITQLRRGDFLNLDLEDGSHHSFIVVDPSQSLVMDLASGEEVYLGSKETPTLPLCPGLVGVGLLLAVNTRLMARVTAVSVNGKTEPADSRLIPFDPRSLRGWRAADYLFDHFLWAGRVRVLPKRQS